MGLSLETASSYCEHPELRLHVGVLVSTALLALLMGKDVCIWYSLSPPCARLGVGTGGAWVELEQMRSDTLFLPVLPVC